MVPAAPVTRAAQAQPQPKLLGRAREKGAWAGSSVTSRTVLPWPPRAHLDDEAGGGTLPDPEAEFPLFPLPQFPLCAGGDEHRVFVDQGFV